ncbi:benzaldehyde dehydrogenase, partial [Streptomyces botrytidirepellens]
MSLLSTADWADRIFTGGWDLPARPGTIDITEPATGQHLGSVGRATEADVAPAARTAAAAG